MMELNQARIEDAIVAEVAARMVDNDVLYERVRDAVNRRIEKLFVDQVDAQINAAVDAAVKEGFSREYQRVSSFGEPVGERTTIREQLEKQIGGYWNTKVDRQGKPATGYGADLTRAEWHMTQLVAADFKGEMKQHVANVAGGLKDRLRSELHGTVNRLLTELFHVNTPGDKAAGRDVQNSTYPSAPGATP